MVRTLAYCSAGSMFAITCCYPTMKGGSIMLTGNDYQAITQIIRDEMKKYEDPTFLKTKLKESQHEANSLSAQVCSKEKQLQQIKELLGRAEWIDEGEELLTITRSDYNKMLGVLYGGIVQ